MVGVDLTPERFEAGERLAREAGVAVEWVEGDAEDLPFDNESFDVVLSSFGAMFAPRHEVTAAEMARVLRRGGRLGLCNWTPEGIQGDFFRALGAHLPPPPDFAQPPLAWGSEGHVRELFVGTGVTLEFERDAVALPYESGDEAFEFGASNFGPLIMLRQVLEPQGAWAGLREKVIQIYDSGAPAEYLIVLGRKS